MRKANVMIEVPDSLYDEVIEPKKKTKAFTKLIVCLLEGYRTDEYINGFVEGTLDAMREESRRSLEDAVSAMKSNLASMDMYTEEISDTMEEGRRAFSNKKEEKKVNEDNGMDFFKEAVREMQKQQSEFQQMILAMMQGNFSGMNGMSNAVNNGNVNSFVASTDENVSEDEFGEDEDIDLFAPVKFERRESKRAEVVKEDTFDKSSVLAGLTEGQIYSF